MKGLITVVGMIMLFSAMLPPCMSHPQIWHQSISRTQINVRGGAVAVGKLNIDVPESGDVLVQFDGECIADVGDRIVLAASNSLNWGVNDGNVSVEAVDGDVNQGSFSHTRLYPVSAGNHTFYALAENYVETAGSGKASIYGSLTIKFFPKRREGAQVKHQGINRTGLDVRASDTVVGKQELQTTTPGLVVVRFDGLCITDVGDRIVLAASNAPRWTPNDGNVAVEAVNADINGESFSHSRIYPVPAGTHTFYAVARNYVETAGNGKASIYGSLTVEFFPDIAGQAFVKHQGISETRINVRGNAVTVGKLNINAPVPGKAVVHFDGLGVGDVGDRIVLAASNATNWLPNDGNVSFEAANADNNTHSFSHTRVYDVPAGPHNFYAVVQNYVEEAGNGQASIYASLTVEFFPGAGENAILSTSKMPANYMLEQNFPNPFNPATTIQYTLRQKELITLRIFNVQGQLIKSLLKAEQIAGTHRIQWDGTNDNDQPVPSGIYVYSLAGETFHESKKMILVK